MFNAPTGHFDDSMADTPSFDPFSSFTNQDDYTEDPGINLRTPVRPVRELATVGGTQQPIGLPVGPSAESSSQDSASDTSSGRKRKVTESPASTHSTEMGVKIEDTMDFTESNVQQFEAPTQPMNHLSLEQQQAGAMPAQFEFGSAASSPAQLRDFSMQPNMAQAQLPIANIAHPYQQSPV
jgi:uncharacterized protein